MKDSSFRYKSKGKGSFQSWYTKGCVTSIELNYTDTNQLIEQLFNAQSRHCKYFLQEWEKIVTLSAWHKSRVSMLKIFDIGKI